MHTPPRGPRCIAPAVIVALALLVLASLGSTPSAAADEPDVPPEVQALLPVGSLIHAALSADLTAGGQTDWAVVYTEDDHTFADAHMAIVVPGTDGWQIARTVTIAFALNSLIRLDTVGGVPAVVFTGVVGAHAVDLLIVRWDGESFATVFEGIGNAAVIDVQDSDGDGTPEVVNRWSPYCEAFAVSPLLVSVYRWDGAAYVEATGGYPDLLTEAEAGVHEALARSSTWTPEGQACLYRALAYLADKRGDAATVEEDCRQAAVIDPLSPEPCPLMG